MLIAQGIQLDKSKCAEELRSANLSSLGQKPDMQINAPRAQTYVGSQRPKNLTR